MGPRPSAVFFSSFFPPAYYLGSLDGLPCPKKDDVSLTLLLVAEMQSFSGTVPASSGT
jgi:hypothetical protein